MQILLLQDIIEGQMPEMALTMGSYDGLHIGHRAIFSKLVSVAQERGLRSGLLTFAPHPRIFFSQHPPSPFLLNTAQEKARSVEETGIDFLITAAFNAELAETHPKAFIENILVKLLNIKYIQIGNNHRFGKGRAGGLSELREGADRLGYSVEISEIVEAEGSPISSSRIRKAVENGEMEFAHRLLGRPYRISGRVVPGDQLGRKLGFPTANLAVSEPFKLIPKIGVYAAWAVTENAERWPAMCNFGYRPTVQGRDLRLEANLLGFEGDLYGQQLELHVARRLRDEIRFPDLDALVAELHSDKAETIKALGLEQSKFA